MPRVSLNKVDYFPHDVNNNKTTLNILFNRFEHKGYYCWFTLLERLGSSENHFIDISKKFSFIELVETVFKLPLDKGIDIIESMVELECIDEEFFNHGKIYSENFVKRLKPVYDKRVNNALSRMELIELLKTEKKWNKEALSLKSKYIAVENRSDLTITDSNNTLTETHTENTKQNLLTSEIIETTRENSLIVNLDVVAQELNVSESEKPKIPAKEVKEVKEVKEDVTKKKKNEFSDDSWQLLYAKKFYNDLVKVLPTIQKPKNFQSWAKDFDMIYKVTVSKTPNKDGKDMRLDRIHHVYKYLCSLPVKPGVFSYRKIIQSPSKFRKHFATLDVESNWSSNIPMEGEKKGSFSYA